MSSSDLKVVSTDGVALAVYRSGDPANPTIVAVHGYPDTHRVWDGVVEILAEQYHVVTYDVRGVGESDKPTDRGSYVIEQMVDDLAMVLDTVADGRKVHLLTHDWGSIQCWDAVTSPEFADRIASFTSISGPSLDHAGAWLRAAREHPGAVAQTLLESSYILFFHLPSLPEFAVRSGWVDAAAKVVGWFGRLTNAGDAAEPRRESDMINGLELFRANMIARLINPIPRYTSIPVQVIAPNRDVLVSPALQTQAPAPYVSNLTVRKVSGGHWIVSESPDSVAEWTTEFIESVGDQPRLG